MVHYITLIEHNKVLLLGCSDNDLENNFRIMHGFGNAEKLQESLNRIMQGIMSIIASALISIQIWI